MRRTIKGLVETVDWKRKEACPDANCAARIANCGAGTDSDRRRIGTQVLSHLQKRGAEGRALTRSPDAAKLVSGVAPVCGNLADMDSVRAALDGVSTLFLLVPNVADELITQAMLTLATAREAGIKGIVYLSVLKGEAYADVPHFAGKYTVKRMIEALDLPATILCPAYFRQFHDLSPFAPLRKRLHSRLRRVHRIEFDWQCDVFELETRECARYVAGCRTDRDRSRPGRRGLLMSFPAP